MNGLITAISTGFTAFTATNLDDILILMLFFSQVNAIFRKRHIVAGQYLGFAVSLGALILVDSRTLENPGLAVLTLVISGLYLLKLATTISQTLQAQAPALKVLTFCVRPQSDHNR